MGPISSHRASPPPTRKEWTVLYCLNGNNDLEPHLIRNLMDAEKVGSSDQVNIVAQLSRPPQKVVHGEKSTKRTNLDGDWTGMRRYYITKGGSRTGLKNKAIESSESSPNHGQASTLADFLKWGIHNYPAERYMVVIGDHGKGFKGIGFDYLHKDVLDLGEMKEALAQVQKETGIKPDVLLLDACEMGAAEVAYQLKDQARFLVASEEIVGAVGLPHRDFLSQLRDNPDADGKQLARWLVDLSALDTEQRLESEKPEAAEQLAALDLGQMKKLGNKIAALAEALGESSMTARQLKKLIRQTQHFNLDYKQKPDSDFRDLLHFCQVLQEEGSDPRVGEAAGQVEGALSKVILGNHASGEASVEEAHGLSVYLPTAPIRQQRQIKAPNGQQTVANSNFSYQESDFDQATGWSTWLEKKFKPSAA